MEIDSEKYYGILLSQPYQDSGEYFLKEISESLRAQGNESDAEDILSLGLPAYQLDVRSLIGFALTHDDYHFSVGGMCHVVGHTVRPLLTTVANHTKALQHEAHPKILKMIDVVSEAPRK